MPQARLPDINTAFNTYRSAARHAFEIKNYGSAIGSLYAFNGLLPDISPGKYRVVISNSEYYSKIKKDMKAICTECEAELDYKDMVCFDVLCPLVVRTISGIQSEKVWLCPKCNKENRLLDTKLIQTVLKEPSFLGVVPNPPQRQDGIMDRNSYHRKFEVWFWTFASELEAKAAQFREEYKGKEELGLELGLIPDAGEHQDI